MKEPKLQEKYQLYIGGEWRDASDGKTFESHCPADGRKLAACAAATEEDVDAAVKAGWKAWKEWKKTSPSERAEVLYKLAECVDEHREHLAMVETLDNGKPIRETMEDDVVSVADHFRYYAAAIMADEGHATMTDDTTMNIILREPIGVVGQIIPWNFPLSMASWKLAPVLASGCCTVLKPAHETSLSLLELMKLAEGIIPAGVVNIITGGGSSTGGFLLEHKGLAKLAFTGSTEVGYTVGKAAAEKIIPATLELGGKSANIIFDDCNWERAAEGAQAGILANQGEVCSAGSRILVHDKIYDRFLEELVKRFNAVKVGLPWEESTQMGAIINEKQMNQILDYVKSGEQEGARIACGGKRITDSGLDKGFFLAPTLLADVKNAMKVAQEEIFGPVACVIRFEDEDEAVEIANDSQYGLAGAVFTQDINRAIRVARAVRTGRMWINSYGDTAAGSPFGGYKKSGIGRETHKMALNAYSQVKSIIIDLKEKPDGTYSK